MEKKTTLVLVVRLFSLFIIFSVVSVCVFFAGIVNTSVPEGKTGIVYSNLHGYYLIPSNKIFWSWQRFIPFSLKVHTFDNTTKTLQFRLSGSLPQAENIARELNLVGGELNYTFSGTLKYFLKPDELPKLLTYNYHYVQNGLFPFYDEMDSKIQSHMQEFVHSDTKVWLDSENLTNLTFSELNTVFPELQFVSLTIDSQQFPDLNSYQNAIDLLNEKHISKLALEKALTEQQIQVSLEQQRRLDLLERYGKLLTQYPILVTFFAVDQQHMLPRDFLKDFFMPHPQVSEQNSEVQQKQTP